MGCVELIETENKKPIVVKDTIIEAKEYQSKDFNFDEHDTICVYTITTDGNIEFLNKEKSNLKPTGLVNIYSSIQDDDTEYYLMLDNGKIVEIWKDISFDDLPKEIQKKYFLEWR